MQKGSEELDFKKTIMNSGLEIKKENIILNELMNKYTTFKIGGPAECLIKINNINELKEVLKFAEKNKINITIIGNGSNLLVTDKGIKGIVLLNRLEDIQIKDNENNIELTVKSGTKMSIIARKCLEQNITGFEELSGIPGTIGGAVIMNAGAHGKEMKNIVKTVKCIDYQGNEYEFSNGELKFEYRNSKLKHKKYIITEVNLILNKGNETEIKNKMGEYKKYRKEKQPIEYPSAGSTFKRGEDYITAKLIDEAGLKGYKIGGAEISKKHSGFIINTENATANDVLELVEYVKKEINLKFNKNIELEIEIIGEK